MLDDAVTKARRVVAELERDAAELSKSSSLSEAERAQASEAIANALAAARRLLDSLQKTAESGNLR